MLELLEHVPGAGVTGFLHALDPLGVPLARVQFIGKPGPHIHQRLASGLAQIVDVELRRSAIVDHLRRQIQSAHVLVGIIIVKECQERR